MGYDNVDLNYIKKNNIALLVTATANAVAVAEHVIAMFLSISKSIAIMIKKFATEILNLIPKKSKHLKK